MPGSDLIPDGSELFLGFTSTQKAGLGPRPIANHETLGFVDLRGGYFHGGTHMHLSHITEDLEAWYLNFDFDERVLTAFQPGMTNVKQGAQTVPQGPHQIPTFAETESKFKQHGPLRAQRVDPGHVASPAADGRTGRHGYPKGTAIPQRADFNTLDNPFAFSLRPRDGPHERHSPPRACTSSSSIRPATTSSATGSRWTASYRTGRSSTSRSASRAQGFNSVLTTTHRQNFLVPPRAHRSFPLAEL